MVSSIRRRRASLTAAVLCALLAGTVVAPTVLCCHSPGSAGGQTMKCCENPEPGHVCPMSQRKAATNGDGASSMQSCDMAGKILALFFQTVGLPAIDEPSVYSPAPAGAIVTHQPRVPFWTARPDSPPPRA
jgi:hypothetical protein